ncbi:MAG: LytTR family DNA-binding domain-containing protein [Bacteroidota bacterium]
MQFDKISAIVIEDEPNARDALIKLLMIHCPEIKVEGHASSVEEGTTLISESNPDLILLDIQLGKRKSFEILENFNNIQSHLVFITAYEQYAIEAFKFSAIDYILKPIHPERLKEAISRASRNIKERKAYQTVDVLLENLKQEGRKKKKIVLSTMDKIHVVEVDQIIKCQSSMNYTTFYLRDQEQLIISKTLKDFEEQLSPSGFFRVHKSWLINGSLIKGYDKRDGGHVIMIDDSKVPVSSLKKEELMRIIKNQH